MKLSGRMTRSTDECEMSRSCQSATFSIAASGVGAHEPRQAAHLLASDRDCACAASPTSPSAPCRTAPRPRRSRSSATRGSRARTSRATPRRSPAWSCSSAWRSRWTICDDTGAGQQPEAVAHAPLDRRIEVRERAHGPGDLPDPDRLARMAQPRRWSAAPRRTTAPASARTSSARHARRACVRSSAVWRCSMARARMASASDAKPASTRSVASTHLQRQRRVDDIRRGEAEMQPSCRRAHALGRPPS